jgi:hypothetical protein
MDMPFYQRLSAEEKEVFDLYKGNSPYASQSCFADFLNDLLRKRQALDPPWDAAARHLDSIVKHDRAEYDMVLYRATFDDFVAPFVKERFYEYPAYPSTSTDSVNIQRHWSNALSGRIPVKLEIRCPMGTVMAPMEAKESFGGDETERLLGRNGCYEIIRRCEVIDPAEISQIMSPFYARGHATLLEYQLRFVGYA